MKIGLGDDVFTVPGAKVGDIIKLSGFKMDQHHLTGFTFLEVVKDGSGAAVWGVHPDYASGKVQIAVVHSKAEQQFVIEYCSEMLPALRAELIRGFARFNLPRETPASIHQQREMRRADDVVRANGGHHYSSGGSIRLLGISIPLDLLLDTDRASRTTQYDA